MEKFRKKDGKIIKAPGWKLPVALIEKVKAKAAKENRFAAEIAEEILEEGLVESYTQLASNLPESWVTKCASCKKYTAKKHVERRYESGREESIDVCDHCYALDYQA